MGNLDGRVWDVSDNFVKICELRVGVCPSVSNPSHDLKMGKKKASKVKLLIGILVRQFSMLM